MFDPIIGWSEAKVDYNFNPSRKKLVGTYNSHQNHFDYLPQNIRWLPNGTAPPSYPKCGYDNSDPSCAPLIDPKESSNLLEMLVINVPLIFILLLALFCICRQYLRYRQTATDWIADPDDLVVVDPNQDHQAKRSKLSKAINAAKEELEGKKYDGGVSGVFGGHSFGSAVSASVGHGHFKRRSGASSDTGFWKKTMVTVRWCHKKSILLTRKLAKEVRQVRSLEHDNLAVFIGACVSKEKVLVVYEYCSRGTLQELIERKEDKFDWTMRAAFLEDILNGLLFLLKSPIGSHGRLTSECCHIERRFVVRLSDYGLPGFFNHNTLESWIGKRNANYLEGQLWQAPELLAADDTLHRTEEFDVYSLGIILQEVILRSAPFSMYPEYDRETLCRYLRVGRLFDGKPLRPFFPEDQVHHVDPELMTLAAACWSENPADRPKLSQVKETIKQAVARMGIENRGSIMDMLLVQMDQQNSRLQAVVEEKCSHILKEKHKADRVIALCLDSVFAEKLKTGQKISPEAFEIVTVLLMQMTHYEHIVLDSTPAQLIDILNEYNHFVDETVKHFDCQKLDIDADLITIASGVPRRNGILNAREICRLALTLQYRVREIRFHHRPNEFVKLQMGVHSGPCVAAVVGKKIPRYTIFGDTVDITKRMLVTGLAQKIHISSYTKDVLETFGSFKTEERGEVFVKGKGALTTYWLAGEDGNKELKTLQTKYEAILLAEDDTVF